MRHASSRTHDALRDARDLEGAHARRSARRQGRRRVHAVLPLPAARRQGRPGAAAPLHGSHRPRDELGRSSMGGPARRAGRGRLDRLEGGGLVPARLRPRGLRRRLVGRRLVPVHLRRVERADGAAGFGRGSGRRGLWDGHEIRCVRVPGRHQVRAVRGRRGGREPAGAAAREQLGAAQRAGRVAGGLRGPRRPDGRPATVLRDDAGRDRSIGVWPGALVERRDLATGDAGVAVHRAGRRLGRGRHPAAKRPAARPGTAHDLRGQVRRGRPRVRPRDVQ